MNYLEYYCDTFDLTIYGQLIIDSSADVVGHIEPNEKYIKFDAAVSPVKVSDLFLPALENCSVH